MSEFKFSCPHCQQHIQADAGYAGMQIACPNCNGNLIVPGTAAAPAPIVSAPPPPPPAPSQPAPIVKATSRSTAGGCPSCGTALPRGAVLCTHCGFNLSTGQRTVAGRPAAMGKPTVAAGDTPWYLTAYPYLGLMFLVLGTLYYFGRENPALMLAFVGIALFYTVTVHIIVAVAAFRDNIGVGFLTLCLPFYALYYVFKVSDNDTLKVLYGFAVITNLCLRFLANTLK